MAVPHRQYTYGAGWAIHRSYLRGAKIRKYLIKKQEKEDFNYELRAQV
jgi:hypothetical protein